MTIERKLGKGKAGGGQRRPHVAAGGGKAAGAAANDPVAADPRFAHISSDPRFSRFPRASRTVEVDERFAGELIDVLAEGEKRAKERGRRSRRSI